jgi:CRISPR-associated protein, TM1812 family
MARNILISFLGTSNYLETYYSLGDYKSTQPVRFIQEALIEHIAKDWTSKDKILIFCTKLSLEKNWYDKGQGNTESEGLFTRLKKLNLPIQIEAVEISEGFTEADIWDIFNKVYHKIEKDDNIYLDITHAFRSIPIFSTILFNYAHYLKGTTLKAVYYGAFEKLGPSYEVKNIPVEKRDTPIIDLTSIIRLQELSTAASNLHQYGKMTTISNLLGLVQGKGRDKQDMNRIKNKMKEFDTAISTCKMDIIKEGKLIGELQSLVSNNIDSQNLTEAHRQLIIKVQEEINMFKPYDTYDNVEAAIDWARNYGMIQQAYTLAEELTISRVKDIITLEHQILQKENDIKCRTFVSALLSLEERKKDEYQNDNEKLKDLFNQLYDNQLISNLRKWYTELANDRNAINHAKKSNKDFKKQFEKNYSEIRKHLNYVRQPL